MMEKTFSPTCWSLELETMILGYEKGGGFLGDDRTFFFGGGGHTVKTEARLLYLNSLLSKFGGLCEYVELLFVF